MNAVTWFEIPASDIKREKGFYEHVPGISLSGMEMGPSQMEMFPRDPTAPGSTGTLAQVGANDGETLVPKMGIGKPGFTSVSRAACGSFASD